MSNIGRYVLTVCGGHALRAVFLTVLGCAEGAVREPHVSNVAVSGGDDELLEACGALIEALGAEDLAIRERAERRLRFLGGVSSKVLETLRCVSQEEQGEVVARAKGIVEWLTPSASSGGLVIDVCASHAPDGMTLFTLSVTNGTGEPHVVAHNSSDAIWSFARIEGISERGPVGITLRHKHKLSQLAAERMISRMVVEPGRTVNYPPIAFFLERDDVCVVKIRFAKLWLSHGGEGRPAVCYDDLEGAGDVVLINPLKRSVR